MEDQQMTPAPPAPPRTETIDVSNAGEVVRATKQARAADHTVRVTETVYPQLTTGDIAVLQMVLGTPWTLHSNLCPTTSDGVTGSPPWTLKLEFVPRYWSEDRDSTALMLPNNVMWRAFSRTFVDYLPSANSIVGRLMASNPAVLERVRAGKDLFFWARFVQLAPRVSPGSFNVEYGVVSEGPASDPVLTERYEGFSPLIQVDNPHRHLYLLPYLRIEGQAIPPSPAVPMAITNT
jgi:hypothetical protein